MSRSLTHRVLKTALLCAFLAASVTQTSCLPTLEGYDIDLSGQQVRLTLLHTSDIHSRLLPYDFNPLKTDVDLGLIPEAGPFGGATRIASLIKRERAKSDRVIHLDSGDSFQGAPVFNINLGEVEYKFLTLLGVDAAVIGNHEFDMGSANFTKQARDAARFPILVANYQWEDMNQSGSNATQLYTFPYTIKNVKGLKVAIIGLGNFGSLNSIIEQGNSLQIIPLEPNEITRSYVNFLRPQVDLVLVTSHAGLTEDQELVQGYDGYYEWKLAEQFVNRSYDPWTVIEWFGDHNSPNSVVHVQIPGVRGIDAILGGHLHIVLNPPQILTDPDGRRVILSHGGAFAKYVNRIDAVIDVPQHGANRVDGAEISSFDFRVFPIDSLWCSEQLHQLYTANFWEPGQFMSNPDVRKGVEACTQGEDLPTTQLLLPYITDLDVKLNLTSLFAYAPRDIARRNNSTGGDSPLGNITADSMRRRQGVEAEVAVTNSLGIRDNLYAGPLTQEAMFNVFPFENTVNIMFLSGGEMQEMFDFIADRSGERGCAAQAQISGARFTMDCAQSQLNNLNIPCDPNGDASDCGSDDRSNRAPWQCLADENSSKGGRCFAHTGTNITINGVPLQTYESYRVATNDYIARGGSGFTVLKRNTTRVETGIPLRDSLVGYMTNFCNCTELLTGQPDSYGNIVGKKGQPCGSRDPANASHWIVDAQQVGFCQDSRTFEEGLKASAEPCTCNEVFNGSATACKTTDFTQLVAQCVARLPAGPWLGKCACRDALAGDVLCGNVTRAMRNFCENPTSVPIAIGVEDGRIQRRVK
jgi:5'-nucleotidase/UDP-sugar diphosphatase